MVYKVMSRQERALCSSLCMCLALAVMSTVAMVYLTVIVYLPAKRELSSGVGDTSVMCTTIDKREVKGDIAACRWSSCGEWCLSRGGGDCTHLTVSVRSNGTDVDFEECADVHRKECPDFELDDIEKRNCKEDHQCTRLHKMFRCELGTCWNITAVYACAYPAEAAGPWLDCKKKRNCVELEGMYDCVRGKCRQIGKWDCERRCTDFPTRDKNVVVQSGNTVVLANCRRAVERGTGETVWRAKDHANKIFVSSCTSLLKVGEGEEAVKASDCINGTLIDRQHLWPVTNYTVLNAVISERGYDNKLDPHATLVPFERDVTIFNSTRLMINTEGCVNTLSYECNAFYRLYGRDGRNQTSPSRFPCYYAPHNPEFVVRNYDPARTKYYFLLFFVVPAAALIVSCGSLFACTRVLSIDNMGHMICGCHDDGNDKDPDSKSLATLPPPEIDICDDDDHGGEAERL